MPSIRCNKFLLVGVLHILLQDGYCSPHVQEMPHVRTTSSLPDHLEADLVKWREGFHARRLTHNANTANPPRHSSVSLGYRLPVSGHISMWYNEVKVMASSSVSYFAVNGHAYGYFGIQQVRKQPFEGRVIFSIWDQLCTGDDQSACPKDKRVQITQCGNDVSCMRFGNEGTGAKAQWDWHSWKLGETYSFVTVAAPHAGDRVEYKGYFYDPASGAWRVLASMIVNRGGKQWSLHGLFSFVEQWSKEDVQDVRWARYGPALVRAETSQIDEFNPVLRASWSHGTVALPKEDQTHVHGNVTVSGSKWAMGLGGDLNKGIANGGMLEVSAPGTCPAPLAAFVALEKQAILPSAAPPPSSVTCGSHSATNCSSCPWCGTAWCGESWCNGECTWQVDTCIAKPRGLASIRCTIPIATTAATTTTSTTTITKTTATDTTTTSMAATATTADESSPIGMIVGIAVGVACLACVIVVALWLRRRRSDREQTTATRGVKTTETRDSSSTIGKEATKQYTWTTLPQYDLPFHDVGTMPASDIEAVKNFVVAQGYSGFSTWVGTAYLKKADFQLTSSDLQSMGPLSTVTFYLPIPVADLNKIACEKAEV